MRGVGWWERVWCGGEWLVAGSGEQEASACQDTMKKLGTYRGKRFDRGACVRLICWRVLDNSGVGVGAVGDYVDVGVAVRGDARRWPSFRAVQWLSRAGIAYHYGK